MPIDPIMIERIRRNDPTLTSLDFSSFEINRVDTEVLAEALKHNATLQTLKLWISDADHAGTAALANALKYNTTLISLHYRSNNGIDEIDYAAFKEALWSNATLRDLLLMSDVVTAKKDCSDIYDKLMINSLAYAIKVAWAKPCEHYWEYSISRPVWINFARGLFQSLIEAIFALRRANDECVAKLTQEVIEKLKAYVGLEGLDLEELPDTAYPNEFIRFLAIWVNAKNVGDAEAQVMALEGLMAPFTDLSLREEAKGLLIGLLNNEYFANLPKNSMQRRALDLLTIGLSCQYPNEKDLMIFALNGYARLNDRLPLSCGEVYQQLENSDAVIADFEALLTQECQKRNCSRDDLRRKCVEEIALGSVLLPSVAPTPNMHQFFAMPTAPTEAPADKKRRSRRSK